MLLKKKNEEGAGELRESSDLQCKPDPKEKEVQ